MEETAMNIRIRPSSLVRALALALPALLLAACGSGRTEERGAQSPPAVSAAKVVIKDLTRWDEFTGRVEPVETVDVRPRVDGYIDKVSYREGEEVKKGDVLFVIDQRPYRAELARAEAELAAAKARSVLASAQAARAMKLTESRMISKDERDERVAAEAQRNADVRAAEAAVETARLNVEFTEIRSPIDGRAGQALVTAGNLVTTQPNATLLTTVVSLDPVYVYFEADEQTYLRYGEMARRGERPISDGSGNTVLVGLANEGGFPHRGHLDFVDNKVDPATGTIRARAVLDNHDRVFTPGLFARVKLLENASFRALLVDDKSILTDQDRKYVYVLGPENRALRRDVKLGRRIEGLRVVTEGLSGGDRVIVYGVQKIFFPGLPVKPQMITMGDPPSAGPEAAAHASGHDRAEATQEPRA
jgi:membrane fusion protein, multidrug efflux system